MGNLFSYKIKHTKLGHFDLNISPLSCPQEVTKMPSTTQLSETSQAIARYLVEHSVNALGGGGAQNDSPHNCYISERQLPDGRTLKVIFSDINKAGAEKPMPNSSLEVSLLPVRDDQMGYQTTEYGLTGAFDDIRILTGIAGAGSALGMTFLFSSHMVNGFTREQIQGQYASLMRQVYSALAGK